MEDGNYSFLFYKEGQLDPSYLDKDIILYGYYDSSLNFNITNISLYESDSLVDGSILGEDDLISFSKNDLYKKFKIEGYFNSSYKDSENNYFISLTSYLNQKKLTIKYDIKNLDETIAKNINELENGDYIYLEARKNNDNAYYDLENLSYLVSGEERFYIHYPTEISFLNTFYSDNKALLDQTIESFKTQEPFVNVINQNVDFQSDDLGNFVLTLFTTDNYPDITISYPYHVNDYINFGKALDLTPFIYNQDYGFKDEYQNDYFDAYKKQSSNYKKEGIYSLPFKESVNCLFYNADVLIGLDLTMIDSSINNSCPLDEKYLSSLTWEEFFNKLAPAIKKYNESVEKIINSENEKSSILAYGDDVDLVETISAQYNYPFLSYKNNKVNLDFNNENIQNLLIKLNGYIKEGFITTAYLNNEEYISSFLRGGNSLFLVDSCMSINFAEPYNGWLGITRIFKGENKISSSISGINISILDHEDENKSLASFLFVKYLLKNENLYKFLDYYVPFKKSLLNYDNYLNNLGEGFPSYSLTLVKEFLNEYSDTFYSPHPYNYFSEIRNIIHNSLSTNDVLSIKDYLSEAKRLEEILN